MNVPRADDYQVAMLGHGPYFGVDQSNNTPVQTTQVSAELHPTMFQKTIASAVEPLAG